jgi:hypothetical protein
MPKNDELRYGAPEETAIRLCVDMQRMSAESTEWSMPGLERVLPNIVSIDHFRRSGENDFHPLRPGPEARSGRRHVAALL